MARIFESLNDMEPSSNGMRLTSSPTSASVASRLYAGGQQRSSRRTSFSSEPDILGSDNDIHSEFSDVSSHVTMLTKTITDMQEKQNAASEERSRLKTENALLQQRLVTMEEQQHLSEQRWKEKFEDEKRRSKDTIDRYEREKELDALKVKFEIEGTQRENEALKKKLESTNDEVTKLQKKNRELQIQLEEALMHVEDLEAERNEIKQEFEQYKLEAQNNIENSSELLEELTRQTDELQRQGGHPRQGSLADQMMNLEEEIDHLKQENKELRRHNEDLQSQILHDSVARGRVLLQDGLSLADEMNTMDNAELMNALKDQELDNQKLRQYINGILMRVIERHPEILEIKDEDLTQDHPNNSS